jgi:hypothetical protein
MKKDNWYWMGHAGHLIVSADCQFHLNTYVGGYIVSTIGEYLPDEAVLKIFAASREYPLILAAQGDAVKSNFIKENKVFERIGAGDDSIYETMVFKARKDKDNKCCPYTGSSFSDIDGERYATAEAAQKGHMKYCLKYSKK